MPEAIVQQIDEPQPWVRRLRPRERSDYERYRSENIEEYREAFNEKLIKFAARVAEIGVEAATEEAAIALAVGFRNTFEAGIEVGMEDARRSNYRSPHDDMPVVSL